MVHEKISGFVLERSLLLIILTALLLPVSGPASVMAQSPSSRLQVKPSSDFLQGRAHSRTALPVVYGADANATIQRPAAPLYDVVALRVSFQPDTSRFTTGNGTFEGALFDTLTARVDPLPHNAGYFNAHLQFLANYVDQVSDGQTQLNTHLIPEVITVSQPMATYSPTGLDATSDAELSKLAGLVEEAWTLASQQSSFDMSGFDPATTALVLFHAGVGRDIELVGTTLDKTPQDLPTIYFSQASLEQLLPATPISFNGFPVQHTILMPRTESRLGFDFIQDIPFLVEFSINGLLAASFFNFLEVPDLFNTETGESAIGPFGLMDPLGLFAFNGLFPPEPSAWTKQYLGWATPDIIEGQDLQTITLNAAGSNGANQMVRVPISSSEYFLVENRHRDLAGDGLQVTIYRDGQTFTQQFENGQEDFNSINIDGFEGGVVIDVDDFDWAVPGGLDADGNQLNGGILIWHIDERILANGLPLNRVNIDEELRAVDLEEADGAQDIGFPTDNIFGPQAFLGSPFDFYYEGNPVVVITSSGEEIGLYENRFGPASYPTSNSNAGGASFVVLDAFSLPGATMTFNYSRASSTGVQPVDGFPALPQEGNVPAHSYLLSLGDGTDAVVYNGSRNQIITSEQGATEPIIIQDFSVGSPIVLPGNRLAWLSTDPQNDATLNVSEISTVATIPLGVKANLDAFANQVILDNQNNRIVVLTNMGSDATVTAVELDPTVQYQTSVIYDDNQPVYGISLTRQGEIAILTGDGVQLGCCSTAWNYAIPDQGSAGALVLGEDANGMVGAFTTQPDNKLIFLQADGTTTEISLSQYVPTGTSYTVNRLPVLVDIERDNTLEAMVTFGPHLLAFSAGGGLVENFPIQLPAAVSTQPLIAETTTENAGWAVFLGAEDGYLHGFWLDNPRQQIVGFPLAVGKTIVATPLYNDGVLYAVDDIGSVRAWNVDGLGAAWWRGQFANTTLSGFVEADFDSASVPGEGAEGLFVDGEIYNWPNPIRSGETFFRLAPTEDARVTITIIDAAGGLIDRLDIERVQGGTSTDVRWQTDAGSGLYYARVEAVTDEGTAETKLIRMAIVR